MEHSVVYEDERTELAQDAIKWRALVKPVMNLEVP
jgi:hypothetical protein